MSSGLAPVARAGWPLHVARLHPASLEPFEVALRITGRDHILSDAGLAELPSQWLYTDALDAGPAIDDLTVGLAAGNAVLDGLLELEVADVADALQEIARFACDVLEEGRGAPLLFRLAVFLRCHGAVEL
jgi:hypothetical protein